jgi:histidyl-tRNA synthetase
MAKRVTGTKDILPEEAGQWQEIEATSRNIFSLYNYREIRTPIIEEAGLFQRSLGESAEIVQKQMFSIEREGERYVLRPEGTAAVARAYIENHLYQEGKGLAKLYYLGPMFRAERPQKGRLRQFHHIGCEAIGSDEPYLDAEVITLADAILNSLGLSGYKINLNSLGCCKDKEKLVGLLRQALKGKLTLLCPDCQQRFRQNPLRLLDCKKQNCQEIVRTLTLKNTYLCNSCQEHFNQVKEALRAAEVNYSENHYLVRGLDYYTRTVFEIAHPDLGAQDALGAGGRYDNLIAELGGPQAGAVGFALGLERLLLVHSSGFIVHSKNLVYVITLGEKARREGLKILAELRKNKLASDMDYANRSLKGAMRKANDLGARFVLIIGEDELKTATVTLKDMCCGGQKTIAQDTVIANIKAACYVPIPAVS